MKNKRMNLLLCVLFTAGSICAMEQDDDAQKRQQSRTQNSDPLLLGGMIRDQSNPGILPVSHIPAIGYCWGLSRSNSYNPDMARRMLLEDRIVSEHDSWYGACGAEYSYSPWNRSFKRSAFSTWQEFANLVSDDAADHDNFILRNLTKTNISCALNRMGEEDKRMHPSEVARLMNVKRQIEELEE